VYPEPSKTFLGMGIKVTVNRQVIHNSIMFIKLLSYVDGCVTNAVSKDKAM
jgi:hypothetical protein